MKLRHGSLLGLACAALLGGCQDRSPQPAPDAAAEAAATPPAGAATVNAAVRWDASVVWEGDLNACRQSESAASRSCLLDAMRAGHARPAALAAAEQVSSGGELAYVSAFHDDMGVGVATVSYPFRANTNEGTRLIDAQGQRIDVDADPTTGDTGTDATLVALLQAHPGTTPFAPAQAAGSTPVEGGGIRLLYRTPLRQCHACADVAQVQIGYEFDAQRRFVGKAVMP